jgi:hypothetical protein
VFRRIWWPYRTTLGKSTGLRACMTTQNRDANRAGCTIYRFDAPLISGECPHLPRRHAIATLDAVVDHHRGEPITDVTTACDMLEDSSRSSTR